jgi:hypothetical protein
VTKDEWAAAYVLQFGWNALNTNIVPGEVAFQSAFQKDTGLNPRVLYGYLFHLRSKSDEETCLLNPLVKGR